MKAARKIGLDRRLEAHFAALRSSLPKEALKRRTANWQMYAAVTGSAMAMVTSASAATIGTREIPTQPLASARIATRHFASANNIPLLKTVRMAMAKRDSGGVVLNGASTGQAPSISPGGIIPNDGKVGIIQPGEWISIYGNNLASETATWNNDFPTSLGGTSVKINGKPAFLEYVSPGLINLQAPDDTATGTVSVVVTTAGGSASSTVNLNSVSPSFSLLDAYYVAAIILRGDGMYDILGPTGNCLGYPTVAAETGDTVAIFGVGFGPTNPAVLAGQVFSGAAPTTDPVFLYINGKSVPTSFVGLSSAGLYQINFVVPPGLGSGDVPIVAIVDGMQTQDNLFFSLQLPVPTKCSAGGTVGGGTAGGGGSGGGFGSGSSFGSGGGSGGGSARLTNGSGPYEPKLKFTPA